MFLNSDFIISTINDIYLFDWIDKLNEVLKPNKQCSSNKAEEFVDDKAWVYSSVYERSTYRRPSRS